MPKTLLGFQSLRFHSRSSLALFALGLALVAPTLPALAQPGGDADEVIALLRRQADDWNRGDLAAFTAVYADDAVFLSPSGVHRGRTEVLARYRDRYPDRKAMGRLSFEVIETRVSADGSMVTLAAHWHLDYPEDADRENASGLTLLALRRTEGTDTSFPWKIVQDASM